MVVTITNCPYVFHDPEELFQFLRCCGKFVWLFDGQYICFDSVPVASIRLAYSLLPFRVCLYTTRTPKELRCPRRTK